MTEKPHLGQIKHWNKSPCNGGLGYRIEGTFIGHPRFHNITGWTSRVISHNRRTGEIETLNSRYTLVPSTYHPTIEGLDEVPRTSPLPALEQAAVNHAIEVASNAVSMLPKGSQAWSEKEFMIAERAAQSALRYLKENLPTSDADENYRRWVVP